MCFLSGSVPARADRRQVEAAPRLNTSRREDGMKSGKSVDADDHVTQLHRRAAGVDGAGVLIG